MAHGIKPDPARVQSSADIPISSLDMDFQELQSLLIMINFIEPFGSHMLHHTTLLRAFLKINNIFTWHKTVNQAFKLLKSFMTTTFQKLLQLYDFSKTISIQVDESRHGLSNCLLQNNTSLPPCPNPCWTQTH